jgi:hypothetical protein
VTALLVIGWLLAIALGARALRLQAELDAAARDGECEAVGLPAPSSLRSVPRAVALAPVAPVFAALDAVARHRARARQTHRHKRGRASRTSPQAVGSRS